MELIIVLLAVAIPTYFLCLWGLKKMAMGNERNRKFIAILPTAIISPIIYFGIFILWLFYISYYPKIDFNQERWHANTEKRYEMSKDIMESEMLVGKTKEEVIDILGSEFYSSEDQLISYSLGFLPGLFNIDVDVLDIYFENGKVTEVIQRKT